MWDGSWRTPTETSMSPIRARWRATVGLAVAWIVAFSAPGWTVAEAPPGGDALPPSAAQSKLVQDPKLVAAKEGGLIRRNGNLVSIATTSVNADALTSYPAAMTLNTGVTGMLVETQGNQYDDQHHAFLDDNYFRFCAAGGATVAAYYWQPTYLTARVGASYTEPYGPHMTTTYWRAADTGTASDTGNGYATQGRGYEMYMAEQVLPPSFSRPGVVNFDSFPTTGGSLPDTRDAINWEQTGHASDWQTWAFYVFHSGAGTQSELVANVKNDIYWYSAPVVVDVNTDVTILGTTYRLPNWTRNVAHTITIVGWNDTTGTFVYLDTCGVLCNGSAGAHNGGTYSVSYATMFKLIQSLGYGYVW